MGDGAGSIREGAETRAEGTAVHGYRAHLDGLRMAAVYLVVLFHVGAHQVSGGFIGVDLFFVLSGYLVTQVLVRELGAPGGLRLQHFYARRIRRLLPAAITVLAATALVYPSMASPAQVEAAAASTRAALLYVANWHYVAESSDYFAAGADRNPLVHFWSLAIEEQFYLVWPLLLSALFAITRSRRDGRRGRQAVVALAVLASAGWAVHLVEAQPDRAYYGTDTRVYQLLAGALIALSPGLVVRARRAQAATRCAAVVAGAGVVILSTPLIDLDAVARGIAATVVASVLIIALEAVPDGAAGRALSLRPVTYLGKISYGTYLWHWPITVVALHLTDDRIGSVPAFAVVALLATAMASVSHALVERPIRERRSLDRAPRVVIGSGLAIGVLAALFAVPRLLDPGGQTTVAAAGTPGSGSDATLTLDLTQAKTDFGPGLRDVDFLPTWSCRDAPSSACTILKAAGPHVLVMGDSQAWSLFPTFATIAEEEGLTLSTAAAAGCPWQRDVFFSEEPIAGCRAFKEDLYGRVIPELAPDLIVVASRNYFTPDGDAQAAIMQAGRDHVDGRDARFPRQFRDATERSLQELGKGGAAVLVVEPVPVTSDDDDPFVCLTEADSVDLCRVTVTPQRQGIDAVYRALAEEGRVVVVDLDRLVCPALPVCDPIVNGEIVRFDRQHLTPRFAATLAGAVTEILSNENLLTG